MEDQLAPIIRNQLEMTDYFTVYDYLARRR